MTNEITVVKDESLVITCLLRAMPLPTIIWTKNDQILFNTERFARSILLFLFFEILFNSNLGCQ